MKRRNVVMTLWHMCIPSVLSAPLLHRSFIWELLHALSLITLYDIHRDYVTIQIYCFAGLDGNERWFGYSEAKGVPYSTTYIVK